MKMLNDYLNMRCSWYNKLVESLEKTLGDVEAVFVIAVFLAICEIILTMFATIEVLIFLDLMVPLLLVGGLGLLVCGVWWLVKTCRGVWENWDIDNGS